MIHSSRPVNSQVVRIVLVGTLRAMPDQDRKEEDVVGKECIEPRGRMGSNRIGILHNPKP